MMVFTAVPREFELGHEGGKRIETATAPLLSYKASLVVIICYVVLIECYKTAMTTYSLDPYQHRSSRTHKVYFQTLRIN
jgi:hypothetical protein